MGVIHLHTSHELLNSSILKTYEARGITAQVKVGMYVSGPWRHPVEALGKQGYWKRKLVGILLSYM